jgi:hypothetical protein
LAGPVAENGQPVLDGPFAELAHAISRWREFHAGQYPLRCPGSTTIDRVLIFTNTMFT